MVWRNKTKFMKMIIIMKKYNLPEINIEKFHQDKMEIFTTKQNAVKQTSAISRSFQSWNADVMHYACFSPL